MVQGNIRFERRKVVDHGGALFVSLPAVWCRNIGIRKGQSVALEWDRETNCLVIHAEDQGAAHETTP